MQIHFFASHSCHRSIDFKQKAFFQRDIEVRDQQTNIGEHSADKEQDISFTRRDQKQKRSDKPDASHKHQTADKQQLNNELK